MTNPVSAHEISALQRFASDSSLGREGAEHAHRTYVRHLVQAARADGIITVEEHAILANATKQLGIAPAFVDECLEVDEPAIMTGQRRFQLQAGDRVVLTGDMQTPRSEWEARLTAVGIVSGSVTKSTRVVAAADPDSLSGKAERARSYGIPIINESALDRLVSELEA